MVHWPVLRKNNSSNPKMLHCLMQVYILVKYKLNLGGGKCFHHNCRNYQCYSTDLFTSSL